MQFLYSEAGNLHRLIATQTEISATAKNCGNLEEKSKRDGGTRITGTELEGENRECRPQQEGTRRMDPSMLAQL